MPHVEDVGEGRGSGDKGPTESRRERGKVVTMSQQTRTEDF